MIVMKHFNLDEIPEIQKVGIYAIHNIKKDKYYIGSTCNLYHMFSLYFRCFNDGWGINRKMSEDFNSLKHIDNFELIVIEEFENEEITNLALRMKERYYIEKYNAVDNGYNSDDPNTGNIPDNQKLSAKDYMGERRKNSVVMFLPLGTKERWKEQAKRMGEKSLTQYIMRLVEEDNIANE